MEKGKRLCNVEIHTGYFENERLQRRSSPDSLTRTDFEVSLSGRKVEILTT